MGYTQDVQRGQQLFTQSYTIASQASQSGVPSMAGIYAAALSLAGGAVADVARQIAQGLQNVAAGEAEGATLAISLFGAEAGPIGAAVGALVAIFSSLPPAHGDNTDSRPLVVQYFDNVPWPQTPPDPLVSRMAGALDNYENLKSRLGQAWGSGPPVQQADIDIALNALVQLFENQAPGQGWNRGVNAINLFELWDTHLCDAPDPNQHPSIADGVLPGTGQRCWFSPFSDPSLRVQGLDTPFEGGADIDIIGRLEQAAVLQWDANKTYAYLIALRTAWENADRGFGTSTPHSDLDARIGYMSSLIPALSASTSGGGGHVIHIPPGGLNFCPTYDPKNPLCLAICKQDPKNSVCPKSTTSTAGTVAKIAGGTAVVALVGTGIYAYLKKEAYSTVWKQIWRKTGGRVLKRH